MNVKLEMTEQEAQFLLEVFDNHVRTKGLAAAGNTLHMAQKLEVAFKLAKEESKEVQE